jgi:hypothetical protein
MMAKDPPGPRYNPGGGLSVSPLLFRPPLLQLLRPAQATLPRVGGSVNSDIISMYRDVRDTAILAQTAYLYGLNWRGNCSTAAVHADPYARGSPPAPRFALSAHAARGPLARPSFGGAPPPAVAVPLPPTAVPSAVLRLVRRCASCVETTWDPWGSPPPSTPLLHVSLF